MQSRWGLSYKDAAHRLYMAEVEKFRAEKHAENAMFAIRSRIDNIITHEIRPVINNLDSQLDQRD
jgi:hypothetical protein